jgi:WD40 repeat protein
MSSGHEDRVWHVSWNPTKPLLASCSADKSVRMYHYKRDPDAPNVTFSHLNSIPTGHTKTVRATAWSPSGETLATASFDSNIGIWEQETSVNDDGSPSKGEWECASLLEGHETECKSVAYSSTGTLLASCSRDKTVWIWEGKCSLFYCHGLKLTCSKYIRIPTSNAWVSSWSIVRM